MGQPVSQTRIDEGLLGLQSVRASVHSLDICVDPRLELLAVIQWLSDYRSKYPLLSQHVFAYTQAVDEHFSRYQTREVIASLNKLISRPFSYENPPFAFGAPPEVMLYLGPDGKLRDDVFENDFLVRRGGGKECLRAFIAHLRHFFHDSRFASFYETHQPFYRQIVLRTAEKIGKRNYITELELFYGTHHGSYTLILVPLYHSVGFGPRVTVTGVHHIYNIMGPHGIKMNLPDFGSESSFVGMQRHEFSHSFVNPLTEQYWSLAEPYFTAYTSPLEAQEIVNESIVRAVTTLLAYAEGEAQGERALHNEESRGFDLVQPLLHRMQKYVRSREKYPTFVEFYPNLLEVFKGHAHTRYTDKSMAQKIKDSA